MMYNLIYTELEGLNKEFNNFLKEPLIELMFKFIYFARFVLTLYLYIYYTYIHSFFDFAYELEVLVILFAD